MKNFVMIMMLIPALLFGDGNLQRLRFSKSSEPFHLNERQLEKAIDAVCADMPQKKSPPIGTIYHNIQRPELIEVKVDGQFFRGGIEKLIKDRVITIEVISDSQVSFKLLDSSKHKDISISIIETVIASDIENNFILDKYWLKKLSSIKVLPNENPITFAAAQPYIKDFQEKVGGIELSGLTDEKTRLKIQEISNIKDDLIKHGYLKPDFKSFDELLVAEKKNKETCNEYKELSEEDILYQNKNYKLSMREGKVEKWTLSYNNVVSKFLVDETAILNIETAHFENVKSLSLNKDDACYVSIGSINETTKSFNCLVNGTVHEIDLANARDYEEIISSIQLLINNLSNYSTIILARDELILGIEKYDKNDVEQVYGDAILNKQYISSRQWLNYTELVKNLKRKCPTKKFIISTGNWFDNYRSTDVPKIKSGKDIIGFVSSGQIEHNQIEEMSSTLKKANIKILDPDNISHPYEIEQSNILILSGHKDDKFEKYLKKLADKRLLDNKIVLIFSCFEAGTTTLNRYLTTVGDAKEVIFFPSQIHPSAVQAILFELSKILNHLDEEKTMLEVFELAAIQAIKRNDDLKSKILEASDYIVQYAFHSILKLNNSHG